MKLNLPEDVFVKPNVAVIPKHGSLVVELETCGPLNQRLNQLIASKLRIMLQFVTKYRALLGAKAVTDLTQDEILAMWNKFSGFRH